ncbi:hypothetical protein D0Y65_024233 [Glycine soja]|uniref:Uncharacterized protein n=1 Tax=Glycine soja TaxID=3848 RepID=A0A445J1A1_GLYSO|nr:hypothetical protein D0Y65_024233 [Glycine soja]
MPNATSLVLTVLGCGGTTKWLGVGGQGHTKKRDCTVNLRWKTTWCGIAWSLWNVGNNKVFRGKAFNKDEALQKIMFHAWEWLRTYNSSFLYSFSQWSSNPGACIKNRSTLAPTVVWLGFGTALVWFGKANVIRACGGVIRMLCALISAGYVILPLIDKYVHVVGVA